MEENKTQNANPNPSNPNSTTKKSIKDMTIEEQAAYYKTMLQKSKKLNLYYDEENKKLKEKLSKYECEDGKTCELIMKFKYDTEIFYLFKDDKKKYFINENLLAKQFVSEIKNDNSIKLYDYEKDLINKDNYLTQIINQYEEKMKRMIEENENTEKKVSSMKSLQENMNTKLENDQIKFVNTIKNILENSNEVYVKLKNLNEAENFDENLTKEIYTKIKENINDLKTIKPENIWLNELNNFIVLILSHILDNTFKIIELEKEKFSCKEKYQKTIDEILLNHQDEKNKLFLQIEELRQKIQNYCNKIAEIEKEKFTISKEKDNSIQKLHRQINSGVNLNYLKNIMISFLMSNDYSIQDGLLPVIFTSLEFNESEIKMVKEKREKNNSGILSYFKK